MSKQLTVSATLSVLAMAVFALFAAPVLRTLDTGAPAAAAAPALEASLPGF